MFVRCRSDLEHEDELVLGAVKCAHAAVCLVPDTEVLELREHGVACTEELAHVAPVHANICDGAIAGGRSRIAQRLAQERHEGLRGHLTRCHSELAMAGLAQAADVTVNRDVIGRVGEDQVCTLVSHEGADRLSVSRVAADEPVSSQRPNIPETGHGRVLVGQGRDLVLTFRWDAWRALFGVVQENVDFGEGEAGEFDVELHLNEGLEFDRQDIAIPAGVLRKLVVGDHIGAALGLGEVGQPERRDALDAKELCCLDPAMAGMAWRTMRFALTWPLGPSVRLMDGTSRRHCRNPAIGHKPAGWEGSPGTRVHSVQAIPTAMLRSPGQSSPICAGRAADPQSAGPRFNPCTPTNNISHLAQQHSRSSRHRLLPDSEKVLIYGLAIAGGVLLVAWCTVSYIYFKARSAANAARRGAHQALTALMAG